MNFWAPFLAFYVAASLTILVAFWRSVWTLSFQSNLRPPWARLAGVLCAVLLAPPYLVLAFLRAFWTGKRQGVRP
jgi:hypothetical protein